ncbi:MAG: InlB B-repeat-containing protein [Eubacterium sp.]|nr:InlB B-repeat-containing protein [Eubacterium sp.]
MVEKRRFDGKARLFAVILGIVTVLALLPLTNGYKTHADSTDFYVPLTITSGFNIDGIYDNGSENNESELDSAGYCYYSVPNKAGSLPADGLITTNTGRYFQLADYTGKNVTRIANKTDSYTLEFDEASTGKYKKLAFLVTGGNNGGTLRYTINFSASGSTPGSVTGTFSVPDWYSGSESIKVYRCGRYDLGSRFPYDTQENFGLFECLVTIPDGYQAYNVNSVVVKADSLTSVDSTICIFGISGIADSSNCTVLFNGNGGIPAVKKMTAVLDGTIILPEAEWYGHTFNGWYDGETKVGEGGTQYTVTKNTVLTADWTDGYYIWGDQNYGRYTEPVKLYKLDDGTFGKPEREDWEFAGWAASPAGQIIPDSQLVSGETYYAKWIKGAYYIYIQDIQVTAENCGDILGDGKVSFDRVTGKLTLNNAVIKINDFAGDVFAAGIYMDEDIPGFSIELKGTNKITQSAGIRNEGIYGIGFFSDCEIKGSGSLDIVMDQPAVAVEAYGLYAEGNITIDGAKVSINAGVGTDCTFGVCIDSDDYEHENLILKNGATLISNTTKAASDGDDNFAVVIGAELRVDKTSYFEAIGKGHALKVSSFEEDTLDLGALVNYAASKNKADPWDYRELYTYRYFRMPYDHKHIWDAGKITKQPTVTADGVKTFTCVQCNETRTEALPKTGGSDGTAFGPGASAVSAEAAILALTNDKDPKGTVFGTLQFKASKIKAASIKLTWKKAAGAKQYVIYANACGKGKKYQKLATVSGTSTTVKKVAGKKLKKGTYYKFLMVAVDANNKVVTTSKTVHAATTGGKVGNPTKITTKAKKNKVTVKVKKTFKLAAKQAGKKIKKHRTVSYETSNAAVATVTAKGVVKGIKKGKCKVYAYAQNGVCTVINVTVK